MDVMMAKLYSVKEAQNYLGVCDETIYRYIKSGKLKAVRVGGLWRISSEALEEFLKKGEQVMGEQMRVADKVRSE